MSQFSLFFKNTLHVSDGRSVQHQEITTVDAETGTCQIELMTAC